MPTLILRCRSIAHICHSTVHRTTCHHKSPSIPNILYLPRPRGPCKSHPSLLYSLWMFSSPVMFVQIITHQLIHDVLPFAWLCLCTWPRQFVFILDEIFFTSSGIWTVLVAQQIKSKDFIFISLTLTPFVMALTWMHRFLANLFLFIHHFYILLFKHYFYLRKYCPVILHITKDLYFNNLYECWTFYSQI